MFILADASPQAGEDYLLSTLRGLQPGTDVKEFVACMDYLTASVQLFKDAFMANDYQEMAQIVQERSRASIFIRDSTCVHRLPPMALGSGRTSVEYKLRALCRALHHETQSLGALKEALSLVRGFCTDLGTESRP